MTITRFDAGPRMSQAVVHNGVVYLAGQVAEGATVGEQTANILSQIDALLARAGTDKSKILAAQIWLNDISRFAEMNGVWEQWVSPGNPPARATVESNLASRQYWVEIMVTAAL